MQQQEKKDVDIVRFFSFNQVKSLPIRPFKVLQAVQVAAVEVTAWVGEKKEKDKDTANFYIFIIWTLGRTISIIKRFPKKGILGPVTRLFSIAALTFTFCRFTGVMRQGNQR